MEFDWTWNAENLWHTSINLITYFTFLFWFVYRQALQNPPADIDTTEQPKVEDIVPIVFKECKKEKIEYKIEALKCLGAILHAHHVDKFKELTDILFPILRKVRISGYYNFIFSGLL